MDFAVIWWRVGAMNGAQAYAASGRQFRALYRAYARGVETLHHRQCPIDLVARKSRFHGEHGVDVFQRFRQVTVLVERVHDRLADGCFARRKMFELELPQQMLTQ